jgi:hypothetical protein
MGHDPALDDHPGLWPERVADQGFEASVVEYLGFVYVITDGAGRVWTMASKQDALELAAENGCTVTECRLNGVFAGNPTS